MVYRISKTTLMVLLISAFNYQLHAQQNTFGDRILNTGSNISGALQSVTEWYDIPIGAAYLYRNYIGKQFKIAPASFDREIAEDFGSAGHFSFGSIDQDIIPKTIFISRLAITTGLNFFTDKNISQDNYRNIFLFQKSLLYTYTLTEIVKGLTHRERPDNSDDRSFFSGHTSTVFAASTFLFLELNDFYNDWNVTENNPLLKTTFKATTFAALYGWAGYVGYSRIHDKKHYLSDVLVGAAVGSLISVFVYDNYINDESNILNKFSLQSFNKTLGLNFSMKF